jgi:hypothetical protein
LTAKSSDGHWYPYALVERVFGVGWWEIGFKGSMLYEILMGHLLFPSVGKHGEGL